jgi:hypothetical protein
VGVGSKPTPIPGLSRLGLMDHRRVARFPVWWLAMNFRRFGLVALLLLARLTAAPSFPHEMSDLKPDPAARFGVLPNGVRYVVYPNKEPQNRASLRLLVLAGSLHEKEDQRGLAHFLEHMAFNGSTHYAPGTLVEFFQRMGMSFGGDTNASTGFDRTQYLLELAHTDPATLTEGMQVLADDAGACCCSTAKSTRSGESSSARSAPVTMWAFAPLLPSSSSCSGTRSCPSAYPSACRR